MLIMTTKVDKRKLIIAAAAVIAAIVLLLTLGGGASEPTASLSTAPAALSAHCGRWLPCGCSSAASKPPSA